MNGAKSHQPCKGCILPRSIPYVRLIKRDFVPLQQAPELILKRELAMMFRLRRDVAPHFINLRVADGEHAVTALPGEVAPLRRAS